MGPTHAGSKPDVLVATPKVTLLWGNVHVGVHLLQAMQGCLSSTKYLPKFSNNQYVYWSVMDLVQPG
jgi:hypothetical protein